MAGTPNPDGELEAMANEWRHDEYECASRMRAALDAYRAEHPPIGKWIRGAPVPGARPAAAAVDPSPPEPECACWLIRDQTWQEPAEWEQNPDCPVHPMTAAVEPETWTSGEQSKSADDPDPPTDDELPLPTDVDQLQEAVLAYRRLLAELEDLLEARTQVGWWHPTIWPPARYRPEDGDEPWLRLGYEPCWVEGEQ